jgi:hypothetical protein
MQLIRLSPELCATERDTTCRWMSEPGGIAMATLSVQQKSSVYSAISECDEVGDVEFLKKYDCGSPRKFWIEDKGKRYPAKAVLYVAHRLEQPQDRRKCREFVGSEPSVRKPGGGFRHVLRHHSRSNLNPILPQSSAKRNALARSITFSFACSRSSALRSILCLDDPRPVLTSADC